MSEMAFFLSGGLLFLLSLVLLFTRVHLIFFGLALGMLNFGALISLAAFSQGAPIHWFSLFSLLFFASALFLCFQHFSPWENLDGWNGLKG